jgi:hypothetical protein
MIGARSNRREFLIHSAVAPLAWRTPWAGFVEQAQEKQEAPLPIAEPHFPDRLHLFVWRNWELANVDRMAQVLATTQEKVLEIGSSMGLPAKLRLSADQLRRIYVTVIRQNWHILSEEQLIELLGWNKVHYEFTLREDDFLSHKLGLKPRCEELRYQAPSPQTKARSEEIKRLLSKTLGPSFVEAGEEPFHFIQELSGTRVSKLRDPNRKPAEDEVDLSGWTLVESGQPGNVLREPLEQFRLYLQSAFDCPTSLSGTQVPSSRTLVFSIEPIAGDVPDSFVITCERDRIIVIAPNRLGLRQAIYCMQDLMTERGGPFLPIGTTRRVRRLTPCYLYSYFALYGDPLMEEDIDPFPDGYLQKLGRLGVNGVWLQAVLRNLAPSKIFPEFGQGWEKRLHNLNRLVDRAGRQGLKVYLYINEPRAMPEAFYSKYPRMKGSPDRADPKFFALCTSVPEVREWLAGSLAHVFAQAPELGGIFSITMSENLTSCFSHGNAGACPRCSRRQGWEVVGEVIKTFRDGVRRSSKDARVIAWDWGWGEDWVRNGADPEKLIGNLPGDVQLLSVSEWNQPVNRGGFRTKVGEYSISVTGPGPRATKHWTAARETGKGILAKVQFNNTWEISAVPYIPVANLIQNHVENLVRTGVQGLQLSWTVGGYPSPNLEVAKEYYYWPVPEREKVLHTVATRRYGTEVASLVVHAWEAFSTAFQEFPYGVAIYTIPTQHGPSNPLRLNETGFQARMILLPYDNYKNWVGPYPPEIVQSQFHKMSELWEEGLKRFRAALTRVPPHRIEEAERDLRIAETCFLHFRSVANQIQFYLLRERLKSSPEDKAAGARMAEIARDEIELARRLYSIARRDSTIGFEATNHYYYRPLDLAEKVLNCDDVIRRLTQSK